MAAPKATKYICGKVVVSQNCGDVRMAEAAVITVGGRLDYSGNTILVVGAAKMMAGGHNKDQA
jgi:hypothetical protein